jgi:hypothetical protein
MILNKYFKHIIYFSVFFAVMHFGPMSLFSDMTVAIIIQIIIFIFLSISIILKGNNKIIIDNFSIFGLLYIFKIILNPYILDSPINIITDFVRYSIFPLSYIWIINTKINNNKLTLFLYNTCIYALISVIPYLLNLIKPIRTGYNLTLFGGAENSEGFIGAFYNTHMAAFSLSISLIVFIFFFRFKRKKTSSYTIFFYILLFAGIIALYKTYIRTGYLIFIGGMLVYMYKTYHPRYFLRYVSLIIISIGISLYNISTDEVLKNRIFQNSIYSERDNKTIEIDNYGSGRPDFWKASVKIWYDSNVLEKFFGIGGPEFQKRMFKVVGLEIGSHNIFFDTLVRNGLFGLYFLIMMFINLYLMNNREKNTKFGVLSISIFWGYILYLFVQGGPFIYTSILLALVFALNSKYNKAKIYSLIINNNNNNSKN